MRCFVKGAPDVLVARGVILLPDGKDGADHRRERHLALDENDRIARAGDG